MKSIIIARVSTDEQKENSPEAQLVRMRNYCKNRELKIAEEFNFVESAYKTKRDVFDVAIKSIEGYIARKEKIAVCWDKVDRLSRNIFDKRVAWLYERAVNDEIELHFVSDGQIINNNMSAGDKFAFGMKLGLSKYYSDAISDNVKRTFEQKRRNGEWTGRVRLGYLNIPADEERRLRRDIVIDPERGLLIQKLFELYVTGNYSLETLKIKITEMGLRSLNGKKLGKSYIEKILNDSFYYGIADSKKYGPYPHKYPHLISKELFDKCQEIKTKRNRNRYKALSKDFIFKGLLRCKHCGCTMTAELKKKPSGLTYVYYSCTNAKGICKRVYVPEAALLKPVYDVLERFETLSEEVCKELVDELRKTTETEITYHKAQVERIRNEYSRIKGMDDRLLQLLLDQSITKADYDKKHQDFADQLQRLNIELEEHTKADYDYQTTVATVLNVARRAKEIFENCSEPAEKRAFLNYLLQNPTVSGKKLEFSIASPFNLVLELADSPTWLPDRDSNPN